jgi:plastocyanin
MRIYKIPVYFLVLIAAFSLGVGAVDEDSATLSERGILNWIHYQKIMLSDNVFKVEIGKDGFQPADLEVILARRNVHGTLIFENNDEGVHRIVFSKHIGNNLGYDMKSPVINPGERWAVDIMKDGIYPFQCTIHPDKLQGMMQVWYEEEDIWQL